MVKGCNDETPRQHHTKVIKASGNAQGIHAIKTAVLQRDYMYNESPEMNPKCACTLLWKVWTEQWRTCAIILEYNLSTYVTIIIKAKGYITSREEHTTLCNGYNHPF